MPFDEKKCGTNAFGIPVELKTSDGMIFYLVGRQQCETLKFWIHLVGSVIEAKNYSYSLLIKNNAGDENYSHQGKVFTLDIGKSNELLFLINPLLIFHIRSSMP